MQDRPELQGQLRLQNPAELWIQFRMELCLDFRLQPWMQSKTHLRAQCRMQLWFEFEAWLRVEFRLRTWRCDAEGGRIDGHESTQSTKEERRRGRMRAGVECAAIRSVRKEQELAMGDGRAFRVGTRPETLGAFRSCPSKPRQPGGPNLV